MSTTGYAYAFDSTFKLRITAKIRFSTAIASLIYQAMSTTGYAYASHYTFKLRTTIGDVYDGRSCGTHHLHFCSSAPLPPGH